ncbi:hypothetical protein M2444_004607 [Paenibacillus sp. PastF-3]|uniref:hypothetical protein n=1 Tax=Paenibacillus sp. PastF-3 TaxID=2940626 RepID=UPI002473350B|nr:hypothetical protein [Paenibacillus sp. PastF-3]MDH6372778.1 hypothetical protein [Paenibacillus sp. PastF-3]
MSDYKEIETYKEIQILQYDTEDGYRADFGTKRSKLVPTVQDVRELIDFYQTPDKWSAE